MDATPDAVSNPRLVFAKISDVVKRTVKKVIMKNNRGARKFSGAT